MKNLKIYFTSDTHGYIYPTDYTNTQLKPQGLLCMMEQFTKDGNTLIIDGGDTIQGSPFTTFMSKQAPAVNPIATVFNRAGYDYITLGNHDFNYGYTYLSNYLNHLDAKCLCANVTDTTGALPIMPSAIHTLENGLKVGLIGVSTDFIPVWEKPENLTHFTVAPTMTSLATHVEALRPQVDLLVGIYHGGFAYDLATHEQLSDSTENVAYDICKAFDFDILLTGHQHLPLSNETLFGTHIVQTPHYGTSFAKVDATLDAHGTVHVTSELIATGSTYNEETYATLLPLEEQVQVWLDQPVGFLDKALIPDDPLDMAQFGSPLANFINQVQLDRTGADISCCSFANSIKGFDATVTVRDIVSTYIYPNTLIVLEVTGGILRAALENVASYFRNDDGMIGISDKFLKPKVAHYNYDYFAPLQYTFDLTQPAGERVCEVTLHGKPVTDATTLTLVMNNYRYSGVGGYDMYPHCPVVKEVLVEMPEIIIDYFEKHERVVVDNGTYLTLIK